MAERRKQRGAQRKLEIVLAGMRGDQSVRDVCREHDVSEALDYNWRDKLLKAGKAARAGKDERRGEKKIRVLERALGRKAYELEIAGEAFRAGSERARRPVPRAGRGGVSHRDHGARDADQPSGDLPHPEAKAGRHQAAGYGDGRPAIAEVARADPTDGTRMVAAMTSRELERPISRERAQRVMRAEGLSQRHRPSGCRRRPRDRTRRADPWHR